MNAVMKTVRCVAPRALEFADWPAPGSPPEGWALVAVAHVGICGTDYHIFEGKHPFLAYPRVMGHEVSGTVVEINGPATVAVGHDVIINPYLSCGKCVACRQGKPNCCVSIEVLGVHRDGAMSEQIIGPRGEPAASRRPVAGRGRDGRVLGRRCSRRSQIDGNGAVAHWLSAPGP